MNVGCLNQQFVSSKINNFQYLLDFKTNPPILPLINIIENHFFQQFRNTKITFRTHFINVTVEPKHPYIYIKIEKRRKFFFFDISSRKKKNCREKIAILMMHESAAVYLSHN